MFQSIKRAKFISQHNFMNEELGDGAKIHLWLQENGWPANEFVDLLMSGSKGLPHHMNVNNFRRITECGYLIVKYKEAWAAKDMYNLLSQNVFASNDKKRLVPMLRDLEGQLRKSQ